MENTWCTFHKCPYISPVAPKSVYSRIPRDFHASTCHVFKKNTLSRKILIT